MPREAEPLKITANRSRLKARFALIFSVTIGVIAGFALMMILDIALG